MPASRSPNHGNKPTGNSRLTARSPGSRAAGSRAESSRPYRLMLPMVLIGLAAMLAVVIAVLPASVVTHFLPPSVRAADFSGSLWHGSAGTIRVNARDAGAIEWRLHPGALLGMTVAADLHWVKVGFVVDAAVKIDRHGFSARDIKGSGPIDDLRDFGMAAGWHGTADINISTLRGSFTQVLAAVGDVKVSNLTSTQIAEGADLGSYELVLAPDAVAADGSVNAELTDAGGPLEVQAVIHYAASQRTGVLSGTLKERPGASPALRHQLDSLAQVRARDPQGRMQVDLEFTL